jgi:hypothetical protein
VIQYNAIFAKLATFQHNHGSNAHTIFQIENELRLQASTILYRPLENVARIEHTAFK